MAKKLTANNVAADETTRLHNARARSDVFKDSLEELYQLDARIGVAIEKHIKQLRAAKTDIMTKLREDYNLTAPMVRARYGSYKLERAAQDSSDQTTLDTLRELFTALPVGGSVDMFAEGNTETRAAETHDAEQAEKEGFAAGKAGRNRDSNPYTAPNQKRIAAAWDTGWEKGQAAIAASLRQPEPASAH